MYRLLAFVIAGAAALLTTTAFADGFDRCDPHWASRHACHGGHVRVVYPPVGYVLDPSDARPPIYIVNQGPVFSGPDVYALPTYSEGLYADLIPYPYIGHGNYRTPYYPTYGYGWHRPRPYRVVGAYAYRPAPSARIITVPSR